MATKAASAPQTNLAPFIAAGSIVAAGIALYFGYPGFALVYLGLIVAAFMATAPVMTGLKEKSGLVLPSGPGEEKAMLRFRMWDSMKWSLIAPNRGWFPIWIEKREQPIAYLADHKIGLLHPLGNWHISALSTQFSTWIAVGLGVLSAGVPVLHTPGGRIIDAIAVYIAVAGLAAAVRANAATDDPAPATAVSNLISEIRGDGKSKAIGLVVGAAIASFVVILIFGIAAQKLKLAQYTGSVQLWEISLGLIALTMGTIFHAGLRGSNLAEWRELVATRAEWKPRWSSSEMKLDQAPRLLTHKRHGELAIVDTFEASASAGAAAALFNLAPLISIQLGSGRRVAFLSVPDVDAQGQPVPGTSHPLRMRVVTWPTGDMPDLAHSDADPELLDLALESAMAWVVTEGGKMGRPILLQTMNIARAAVTDEIEEEDDDDIEWDGGEVDSEDEPTEEEPSNKVAPPIPGAWATQWAFPDTQGGLSAIRQFGGALGNELGVEVIVDPGNGAVYVGALTENIPEFTDTGLSKHFNEMAIEAKWSARWGDVLKQAARQPLVQHGVYEEARLPTGPNGARRVLVMRQPFVIPQGVSILEFIQPPVRIEPALSTTLKAAPFVSVTGYSGQNGIKPGHRHQQAIAVMWSDADLPETPDLVVPSENNKAATWLLSGLINRAFDVSKLARPELITAVPLTDKISKGHMWKISLKLYGGVTIAEVRAQAQKIRQALRSSWLRVADGGDGVVTIVSGADPSTAGFAFARTSKRLSNQDYVTSLDWEQAFLVSKVMGDGGSLPKLLKTDVLPNNPNVQVIDFVLPAPVTKSMVKEKTAALMTATKNSFIDVRSGIDGADSVRILVSKVSPLPDRADVDWTYVDSVDGILPFATSIEGNPVSYDCRTDPHILIAGASGGGKSVALQVVLYPAVVHGAEIYVVDPTKAGADFGFVRPYAHAFATTVDEADALMKHVYKEVIRRKNLNAEYQVGGYRDLPEDIRPKHIYLVMDEFTSLMQPDPVSKAVSDDPEVEEERQLVLRNNSAKARIGTMTGKIAREARSAGVTLVLATQKLSAAMLDTIPGAGDLKTNLSRMLMGNATFGEKQSALKNAIDAPTLGEHVPRGRGLWETSAGIAEVIQVWFEPSQATFTAKLAERRAPLDEALKVNLETLAVKPIAAIPEFRDITGKTGDRVQVEDLGDVEVDIDFDSMLAAMDAEENGTDVLEAENLEEQEPVLPDGPVAEEEPKAPVHLLSNEHPETAIFLDVDGVIAPIATAAGDPAWGEWSQLNTSLGAVTFSPVMLDALATSGAKIVWTTDWADEANDAFADALRRGLLPVLEPGAGEDYGWWKLGAIQDYVLAHPGLKRVIWIDDKINDEGPTGLTWNELLTEILEDDGVKTGFIIPDNGIGISRTDWAQAEEWIAEDSGKIDVPVATADAAEPAWNLTPAAAEEKLAEEVEPTWSLNGLSGAVETAADTSFDDAPEEEDPAPVVPPLTVTADEFVAPTPAVPAATDFDDEFAAPVSRRVVNKAVASDFD